MTSQFDSIQEAPPTRVEPVRLGAQDLGVSFDNNPIISHLDLEIPPGEFTVIIGPNGSGKSTLLRSLARLVKPVAGRVLLNNQDVSTIKPKEFARRVGLLPQSAQAPSGITTFDLISRGRYPHQSILQQWSAADEAAVRSAMAATAVTELANRSVAELSGGQRQRVWVAMVLAQETEVMLLDEPTTYLDLAHQIDLLELFDNLMFDNHRTMVAVLHDLNHAARYADFLVVMKSGSIVASGNPSQILNADLVEEVFGLSSQVVPDPITGTPMIIPAAGRRGHINPTGPEIRTNEPVR